MHTRVITARVCVRRALASREVFEALSPDASSGVRQLRAHYLYADAGAAPAERLAPPYAHLLRDFRSGAAAVPPEVNPARAATGYSHVAPVVDMTLYLPYLERLVTSLGGAFHCGVTLPSLAAAAAAAAAAPGRRGRADVVVNCAALGAAALCDDAHLTPVRGVKVYVHAPFLTGALYSAEPRDASPDFTTIIPRATGGIVACSGVAQPGATSLRVEAHEVDAILRRCAALLPALAAAPVVGTLGGPAAAARRRRGRGAPAGGASRRGR
jgi:D-amino-acid oxidase